MILETGSERRNPTTFQPRHVFLKYQEKHSSGPNERRFVCQSYDMYSWKGRKTLDDERGRAFLVRRGAPLLFQHFWWGDDERTNKNVCKTCTKRSKSGSAQTKRTKKRERKEEIQCKFCFAWVCFMLRVHRRRRCCCRFGLPLLAGWVMV